jgi:hypothetical protein
MWGHMGLINIINNMKNEITHPLERYKRIADPTIRQQCIDNFNEKLYSSRFDNGTISNSIIEGFIWRDTPQGQTYWEVIYNKSINGTLELLPEPIEEPNTMFLIYDGVDKVITDETLTLIKVSELDQLRSENEKLRGYLKSYYDKDHLWLTDNDKQIFESKVKELLNK